MPQTLMPHTNALPALPARQPKPACDCRRAVLLAAWLALPLAPFGTPAGAAFGLAALTAAVAAPSPAAAQLSLEAAKAQGLVGEKADGLVGAVKRPPGGEVKALIQRVNRERMDRYRAIAARNGSPVEAVQAIAGEKLINRAPRGTWINPGNGWRQK